MTFFFPSLLLLLLNVSSILLGTVAFLSLFKYDSPAAILQSAALCVPRVDNSKRRNSADFKHFRLLWLCAAAFLLIPII